LIAPHAGGKQCVNGIKVCSVKPPRNRRERVTGTIWAVYRAAVLQDADIYHFHDPELLPIGVLLKLRGKRVIYDVHEDFKGTMDGKGWIPWGLRGIAAVGVSACEAALSRTCDRVIAATPTIARNFPQERTRLVQNYPWLHELEVPDATPYEQREAIAAYVGWLDDSRGMREMALAVELAAKQTPVKLVIGGKVRGGGKASFERDGTNELVEFLGFLSRPQVGELIAQARIGMVTFLPNGNTVSAQPTKLFEYMSGAIPVIASDFPVYRKIVETAACGLLVDPRNPSAIAEAMVWLLRHPFEAAEMGRNGRRAVVEKYNWEREAEYLIAAYAELLPVRESECHPEKHFQKS
jgi:glycosyltransferase involved in cell wall biosynthesis